MSLRRPDPSRFMIHRLLAASAASRSKTTCRPSGEMVSPRALSSPREVNRVSFCVAKLYSKRSVWMFRGTYMSLKMKPDASGNHSM